MKHKKDLSWLSAPAFFLIIGMLFLTATKQGERNTALTGKTPETKAVVK